MPNDSGGEDVLDCVMWMCLLSIPFGIWLGYTTQAKAIATNELLLYDTAEQKKSMVSGDYCPRLYHKPGGHRIGHSHPFLG